MHLFTELLVDLICTWIIFSSKIPTPCTQPRRHLHCFCTTALILYHGATLAVIHHSAIVTTFLWENNNNINTGRTTLNLYIAIIPGILLLYPVYYYCALLLSWAIELAPNTLQVAFSSLP